jgi:YbbR domain-containing protein
VGAQYSLDISAPTISPATVNVKGPASELGKVEYAEMVLSPGNITGSFKSSGALTLKDASGNTIDSRYLQLSAKDAEAAYTVYTTKILPLVFDYKHGYFALNGTSVIVEPAQIAVRGQVERLAQLSSIKVGTIDETKIAANGIYQYALNIPEGVEIVSSGEGGVPDSVGANITLGGYVGRVSVPMEEFVVRNDLANGKAITILDSQLTVEVFGTGMSALYLESDDISVTLDITSIGIGEQFVPATVSIRKGDSASLYVVGSYSVWMRIEEVH